MEYDRLVTSVLSPKSRDASWLFLYCANEVLNMKNINHEKLKSIYYHLKHYELFSDPDADPEWVVNRIKDICESDEWTCLPEHVESAKLHDKQIQHVRQHSNYDSKLYE